MNAAGTAYVWATPTGTGAPVLATSPTLVTPALGTPTALVGTNISGTAASLTAGTVTTNANMTGDVTSVGNATTIATNVVTNAKAAQMAAHTFKGNNTGSTANALDLTATQLTAELNVLVGDSGSGGTKGLVPAPASGDAAALKFLKANGTWAVPAGAGDVAGPASSVANGVVGFSGTTGKAIKDLGIGTSSQVLVGGTTPAFGNVPAAAIPAATTGARGGITITTPTVQKFLSGSGTYTPAAGVAYIRVNMVGGGGGGAGCNTSGGFTAGTAGGNTTFSTLIAAGGAGASASSTVGGAGGAATISTGLGIALPGNTGGGGQTNPSSTPTTNSVGGAGGISPFGGAGLFNTASGISNSATANTGSGGAGGAATVGAGTGWNGGAGGGSGAYLDVIFAVGTYSYAVGTSGAGGSANYSAGGAGGSGAIYVTEFYY